MSIAGAQPRQADFSAFYDSGLEARGLPAQLDAVIDLNPPTASLLFAPFSYFDPERAFLAWTLLSIACAAAVIGLGVATLPARPRRWWALLVGALLLSVPGFAVLREGQTCWVVALPVAVAWCVRAHAWLSGGALALAALLKPQVVLMAVLLPWTTTWRMICCGVAAVSLHVAWAGIDAWLAWFAKRDAIWWLAAPANASLWGQAARLVGATGPAELGWAVTIGVLVVLVALVAVAWAQPVEQRWSLAVLWMVLASPIGWTGYLLYGLLPLIARWRRSVLAWISIALLAVPIPTAWFETLWPAFTTAWRSVWTVSLLGLYVAYVRRPIQRA